MMERLIAEKERLITEKDKHITKLLAEKNLSTCA
jgi:hypothetical protein